MFKKLKMKSLEEKKLENELSNGEKELHRDMGGSKINYSRIKRK
jgi:hypothetical protein